MSTRYGRLSEPRVGPDLLRLVRSGKVYSLAYPIQPDTPLGETSSGVSIRLHRRHQDFTYEGPFGEATERIEMSGHTATHLDALCHISEEVDGIPLLYGDVPALEVQGEQGFAALGIERCPPVITRGVLLDVARDKGVEVLPDGYGIAPADLAGCAEREGVTVGPGDCVLIRTGFAKYRDAERQRYLTVGAGPTPEACRWLGEQGIALAGSDTVSFEQVPSPHLGHLELMRRRGVLLLKQVNLEALAADQVWKFLFLALPLKIVGATASPVHPVAIA
ncbi:MAG: cyclase family protein [Anaerolineae bacterium]|nr:cyclase family protein [Anaerolineae bacterium]